MRTTDAFLTLQMRRGGGPSGFPHGRRASRMPRKRSAATASRAPISPPTGSRSAAGRNFYAHVVLGRDVSARVRGEAFAILDRLRIEPRSG